MAIENDKDLDAIMEQRAVQKQEEAKPIIQFDTAKKKDETVQNDNTAKELVKQGVDAAIMHKLKNDETVQERFLETAGKVVDANLNEAENQAEADEKASLLKLNKDACDLYGIDEKQFQNGL